MKTRLRSLLIAFAVLACMLGVRADDEEETMVKIGEEAPAFECTTLDGKKINLSELRGKVVVVNFFATWCPPCVAEMPNLEKKVWQKFKGKKFAMVALGFEHENKELVDFRKKHKLTFPLAGDPKGEIYAKYVKQYLPHTYVIGADGKVAFQSSDSDKAEMTELVGVVQQALDKAK